MAAMVRILLEGGADADDGGGAGLPAIAAAARGHVAVLRILSDLGADLDLQEDTSTRWTALMWAANNDDAQTIAVLLELGADPAVKDADGATARDIAERLGNQAALDAP